MSQNSLDLAQLFSTVGKTLEKSRTTLNQADNGNGNHGDNMVEIFEVITQAMKERHGAQPADQLEYAAQLLRRKQNGSAQVYAEGLGQAAQQFQGQAALDPAAGLQLVQMLLGGGQSPVGSAQQDPVASLLGGLFGGTSESTNQGEAAFDAGDLLSAGMAFMNAKQSGASTGEAAIKALLSASPLGQSEHRQQSGQLVGNTLLEALGALNGDK